MASAPSNTGPDGESFLRTCSEPDGVWPPLTTLRQSGRAGAPAADTQQPADLPQTAAERVMPLLDSWPRFGVMAVRIDPPGANPALTAALEHLLQELEKSCRALWFAWRNDLYGCALPEMNPAAALSMAQKLQHDLSRRRPETISVGISAFPLLDFDCTQSLANAYKALDHAAFFGPASAVVCDAVTLNISGDRAYQDGNLTLAMAEYRNALRLDPANVNVHNSLGVCQAKSGDLAVARRSFEAALAADPAEGMAVYNIGMLELLEGRPQEALEHFQNAYGLDRATFEIPFQIGKLLARQHRWSEARPYLEAAAAIYAEHGAVFTQLGDCLAAVGECRPAIAAYKKAVKLSPNDAAALSALGALYDEAGENAQVCLAFCRQSVYIEPHNGLFRHRLARLYEKHAQCDRALAEYREAAALGHDCAERIAALQEKLGAAADTRSCCG